MPTSQSPYHPRDPRHSAFQGALILYSKVVAADSFQSAVNIFVSSLVADLGATRASFALRDRSSMQLLAMSDRELIRARADTEQMLTGAMDEAAEQGQTLSYPQPSAAEALVAPVLLEHQALHSHTGNALVTIALGVDGQRFGAVCVEFDECKALDPAEIERWEAMVVLAGFALRWIHAASKPLHQRAVAAGQGWMAALRQPERRARRNVLLAVLTVFVVLALVPFERTVSGRARIEGAQQRIMSAPSDGFIKAAHVRPGDRVKAGAALLDLVDEDLALEIDRWSSQLAQHENAYAAAMAKSDRVAASTSFARVAEAQAQLALIEVERERGRITAPVDALVVQGDMTQSIGAPVRQGDPLMTLATTDRYRVIVEVDETDIAQVQAGQVGKLVVSSLPWDEHAVIVERITPMAKAVNGRNVFEVEARPNQAVTVLRPGLLGHADIAVGRMPPLWSWGRHVLDRVRLTYWNWLA